jgi:hypothetical protein
MFLSKYQLSELGHVSCVDNIAIYNSTVHEIHQTSNYKEGMLFHIPLHGVSRYDGLEAR